MTIKLIDHNSAGYEQMLELRRRVLLAPIGIPSSYIQVAKEKDDVLIGAFEHGTLMGCCILSTKEAQTVQLRQMAVDTAQQGKGIGRALLSFAEETARQKGHALLLMHARDAVIPFYEKCGYQTVGKEFKEVGIAHHRMQKRLAP